MGGDFSLWSLCCARLRVKVTCSVNCSVLSLMMRPPVFQTVHYGLAFDESAVECWGGGEGGSGCDNCDMDFSQAVVELLSQNSPSMAGYRLHTLG